MRPIELVAHNLRTWTSFVISIDGAMSFLSIAQRQSGATGSSFGRDVVELGATSRFALPDQFCDQRRPSRLMARSKTRPIVSMKILVEQNEVAKMRVCLEPGIATKTARCDVIER